MNNILNNAAYVRTAWPLQLNLAVTHKACRNYFIHRIARTSLALIAFCCGKKIKITRELFERDPFECQRQIAFALSQSQLAAVSDVIFHKPTLRPQCVPDSTATPMRCDSPVQTPGVRSWHPLPCNPLLLKPVCTCTRLLHV